MALIQRRIGTDSLEGYYTPRHGWLHPPRQQPDICEWLIAYGDAHTPSTIQMVEAQDDFMKSSWEVMRSSWATLARGDREVTRVWQALATDNPRVKLAKDCVRTHAHRSLTYQRASAVAQHYGLPPPMPEYYSDRALGDPWTDPVPTAIGKITALRNAHLPRLR